VLFNCFSFWFCKEISDVLLLVLQINVWFYHGDSKKTQQLNKKSTQKHSYLHWRFNRKLPAKVHHREENVGWKMINHQLCTKKWHCQYPNTLKAKQISNLALLEHKKRGLTCRMTKITKNGTKFQTKNFSQYFRKNEQL
jgi:hypothetical protein